MRARTDGTAGGVDLRSQAGAPSGAGAVVSAVRRGHIAGVCLAAWLSACSTQSGTTTADIDGSHDLALVGDLLFVTSSDDNELRVIDVALGTPDFVRAPNPLHPLSIPVADRPVALAQDVNWEDPGEDSDSFVYALSANSREVSIVGAARESLVQKAKAILNAGGTITALAARGAIGGPSTLFFATYDGSTGRGRIDQFSVILPSDPNEPVALTRGVPLAEVCGVVTSLLVLPNGQLAWSSRPSEAVNCTSSDPAAGFINVSGEKKTLNFPFPVRKLFTQAGFTDQTTNATHEPAERIFGIFDERSCSGGPECRGIVAVVGPNGSTANPAGVNCGGAPGNIACDFTQRAMLPIFTRGELIMGAATLPGGAPLLPASAVTLATPMTGVYSTSDGRIVFFDAQNLRHFDVDSSAPRTSDVLRLRAPDGSLLALSGGPVAETIALADGAARDETIHFTFLGDLPGFSKIAPPPIASMTLNVTVNPTGIVQPEDLAYVQGTGCSGSAKVTTFGPATGGGFTITFDTPIPNCGTLSIRPRDDDPKPWVVTGTSSGFLGRLAPSAGPTDIQELPPVPEQARRNELFFNRPPGFDPANPPPLLKLAFLDPTSLPPGASRQGYRFEMTTEDGFRIAEVTRETTGGINTVAGSLVFRPPQELWVTYPSDNTVCRFELSSVAAGGHADGDPCLR